MKNAKGTRNEVVDKAFELIDEASSFEKIEKILVTAKKEGFEIEISGVETESAVNLHVSFNGKFRKVLVAYIANGQWKIAENAMEVYMNLLPIVVYVHQVWGKNVYGFVETQVKQVKRVRYVAPAKTVVEDDDEDED